MIQFTKVINCFYLIGFILQSIPSISTNPAIFTFIPLSLMVLGGMGQEAYADWKRWRQDKATNGQSARRVILGKSSDSKEE